MLYLLKIEIDNIVYLGGGMTDGENKILFGGGRGDSL